MATDLNARLGRGVGSGYTFKKLIYQMVGELREASHTMSGMMRRASGIEHQLKLSVLIIMYTISHNRMYSLVYL